jgi:uncharacterized protein YlaI
MEVSYMEVSYIMYRVTKRFTTAGFNTLKALFEHLLGSPIAGFDEALLLDEFYGDSPELDKLHRQGFIVNQGRYVFIKVEEKVTPPVLDFAVNVPIRSPQAFYEFLEALTRTPEHECEVCPICAERIIDFQSEVRTPKHCYHYGCYSTARRQGNVGRDDKGPNHGKSAILCDKCYCILLPPQAISIDTLGAFHCDCFPLEPHPDVLVFGCFPLEPHPDDLVFDLTVDDEDDEAHSTKRPRPEETHRCPNCKATVNDLQNIHVHEGRFSTKPANDLQNIHVHEGEIFHEACYLDRVRKSKMAAPPTYNPPAHDDDTRIDCPFPNCKKKARDERSLLGHYKNYHRDDEAYPNMCSQIAMSHECPVCKAYHCSDSPST